MQSNLWGMRKVRCALYRTNKILPIMPHYARMPGLAYYAGIYASIMWTGLVWGPDYYYTPSGYSPPVKVTKKYVLEGGAVIKTSFNQPAQPPPGGPYPTHVRARAL